MDKKDNTVAAKEEKEEEEHKKGIAKHDVFGMSIKAKDVGNDGDVRATDTNLQVSCTISLVQQCSADCIAPQLALVSLKQHKANALYAGCYSDIFI